MKIDKLRILNFLAGLNQDYDQIRAQILGREPFPNLMQAYVSVQSEESRSVMLYAPQQDKTALAAMPQKEVDKNKANYGDENKTKESVAVA